MCKYIDCANNDRQEQLDEEDELMLDAKDQPECFEINLKIG